MWANSLREVMNSNMERRNFRIFGPDETASNRLGDLFEATDRTCGTSSQTTTFADGRRMEIVGEHTCQGWLEGYLLTGRHGFSRYDIHRGLHCLTSTPSETSAKDILA